MDGAFYLISSQGDANYNQSVLEHLYHSVADGFVCMQVYIPSPCVSIGRHIELNQSKDLQINRRLCGGDIIQLRSTCVVVQFISSIQDFDLRRQTAVVSLALKMLGIECRRDDKNRIYLTNGKEACLNIYDISGKICRQMIVLNIGSTMNANTNLPKALFQYGIDEYQCIDAIEQSFTSLYRVNKKINQESLDSKKISDFYNFFSSDEWLLTENSSSPYEQYNWGNLSIMMKQNAGIIEDFRIYTNSYAAEFIASIAPAIIGSACLNGTIKNKILTLPYANKNLYMIRDILRTIENILSKGTS